MNKEELAAKLNGREYGEEITEEYNALAKEAGLVVVHGGGDDLMEFRGAIDDEAGAYEGTTVPIDDGGIIPSREDIIDSASEMTDRELADAFTRLADGGHNLSAIWGQEGYSWTYSFDVPHATFEIMDDGEKYCRGIVFSLSDCR